MNDGGINRDGTTSRPWHTWTYRKYCDINSNIISFVAHRASIADGDLIVRAVNAWDDPAALLSRIEELKKGTVG